MKGRPDVLPEPRSRARRVQWWTCIGALLAVATPLVGLLGHTTVRTADGATRPALVYALFELADTAVLIIALVVRLRWLRLCRRNADLWAPGQATYSFGWVVGAWFTPLLMWWRPRRIVLDIIRASGGSDGTAADGIVRFVNTWWALRVSYSVASSCAIALKGAMSTSTSLFVQLGLSVVGLAGLIYFVVLVGRIAALQEARWEEHPTGQPVRA